MKRSVVVTGGSSGIGRQLVTTFSEAGDSVLFTYHRGRDRADELIRNLKGCKISASALDQGSVESIDEFCEVLPERIDILIMNAALGTKTVETYAKSKEDQDLALMRVNSLGPQWIVERVLPRMRKQGSGKIILISSVDGGIGHFPGARYADGMSKAALTHFARQLSSEVVSSPIDVFTICPGATETPMLEASTLSRLSKKQKKTFCDALPAGRLVQAKEVASLALHLCTDAGKILRGSVLDASLGLGNWPATMDRR